MTAPRNIAGLFGASPRPLAEWTEDIGDVLWWRFPIQEPPYVGSPNDLGQVVEFEIRTYTQTTMHRTHIGGWPGTHTHWTPIPMPEAPT